MIFRSPHPDFTVPDMSFPDFLLAGCRERADAPAFVDGPSGRVVTFRQLADTAVCFAAGLAADGLGQGDVVAILSPNIPEYAAVLIGALHAGCRVTTVNALFTAGEIRYQLADCGARLIVTVPELAGKAGEAASGLPVRGVVVVGDAQGATPLARVVDKGRDLIEAGGWRQTAVDPLTDVAVILYSSGTTGGSKGVLLTHRNLVANVLQCHASLPSGAGDTVIAVLPSRTCTAWSS